MECRYTHREQFCGIYSDNAENISLSGNIFSLIYGYYTVYWHVYLYIYVRIHLIYLYKTKSMHDANVANSRIFLFHVPIAARPQSGYSVMRTGNVFAWIMACSAYRFTRPTLYICNLAKWNAESTLLFRSGSSTISGCKLVMLETCVKC